MTKFTCVSVSVLSLVLAAGGAWADGRVTITDATGVYNGTDGAGGAFTATRATPGANGDYNGVYGGNGTTGNAFLTFCLEYTEHLGFGGTYFTEISTSAKNGGVSGGNPDPLSSTTALMYRQFRAIGAGGNTTGLFGGLLGTSLSSAETSAIQHAIWYSEGEIASISGTALSLYNWANTNNNGSLYGIRVMRLWSNYNAQTRVYSGNAQDLLTMVPLPPGAYAGMGTLAGVLGLGYIRRRKLAAC